MEKRWWIIGIVVLIILVVLILFIIPFFLGFSYCELEPKSAPSWEIGGGGGNANVRAMCYYHLAGQNHNPKLCYILESRDPGYYNKDECLEDYFVESHDYSICKNITSLSNQAGCYEYEAKDTGDSNYCEKISKDSGRDSKDDCYSYFATYTKNADTAKRLDACEKVKSLDGFNPNRACCYQFTALAILDNSICDKIENVKNSDNYSQCTKEICNNAIDRQKALNA